MYDEFERAVTGKSGERLSFLAWLSIALGTLFALGIVAAGLTAIHLRSQVAEIAHVIQQELGAHPGLAAQAMVEQLESHSSLLSIPPEKGVALLQDLGPDAPADAFMEDFFGGSLDLFPEGQEIIEGFKSRARDGIQEMKSGEGRVRMDLIRGEGGGSLVIESGEGQVRFDLKKTEDGGYLAIDSDEGQVRFDLIKNDDGGSLVIDSEDGQVRFDVTGGEDGGTMVIRTDDATLRFAAGEYAEAMPGWVRRMDGMPADPQKVYSLNSKEGSMGAVAWEVDGSPGEVLSFYSEWLQGEGFELRDAHRVRRDGGADQASLWARNESAGRVVFLVAGQGEGATKVLLGYGQRQGPG